MHILSRSLPKKSPLHRGNDSAFKNAEHTQTHAYTRAHTQTNERTNEQTNKHFQNTLPPVATNPYGAAVAQGPQKQMDAKNNTIKNKATLKKKQTNNWEQHIVRSHLVGPHHVFGGHLELLSSNE